MMKYFKDCKTAEDVKSRYRELAKKLHPDCGGDAEQFKTMMNEYTEAFNRLKSVHVNQAGETYEKETTETPEEFAEIINKVIHFDGVHVEIIGSWVWLTGATMLYKEEIKAAGFWWSKTKRPGTGTDQIRRPGAAAAIVWKACATTGEPYIWTRTRNHHSRDRMPRAEDARETSPAWIAARRGACT